MASRVFDGGVLKGVFAMTGGGGEVTIYGWCSKCRWIPDQVGAETPPVRKDKERRVGRDALCWGFVKIGWGYMLRCGEALREGVRPDGVCFL
jgi:hypothetical protein